MNRKVVLACTAAAPIAAAAIWPVSVPAAVAVLLGMHSVFMVYPTLAARSQWLGPVVTGFTPDGREIWLTIDDGPDPRDTPAILDLLDQANAKASFFLKGSAVETMPQLAREIASRGHEIGNHSYSHPSSSFWGLGPSAIAREIDRCTRAIEDATGITPRRFRAPVGMKNFFVHPLLEKRGMQLIAWSARGFDGLVQAPESTTRRILEAVAPGGIILAHEGRSDHHGKRVNEAMLSALLPQITRAGYSFVVPSDDRLLCGGRNTNK